MQKHCLDRTCELHHMMQYITFHLATPCEPCQNRASLHFTAPPTNVTYASVCQRGENFALGFGNCSPLQKYNFQGPPSSSMCPTVSLHHWFIGFGDRKKSRKGLFAIIKVVVRPLLVTPPLKGSKDTLAPGSPNHQPGKSIGVHRFLRKW